MRNIEKNELNFFLQKYVNKINNQNMVKSYLKDKCDRKYNYKYIH